MTDRVKGFTVVLEKEMRIDDAQALIDAIGCLRGVIKVEPEIMTGSDYFLREQVRHEMGQKLWHVLYPEKKDGS